MKLIDELYYGNLCVNGKLMKHNKTCQQALQSVEQNEEILSKLLTGKELQLFNEVLTDYSIIDGESNVANFTTGFKLGVRLAMEIMDEDIEVCLKEIL